MKTLKVLGFLLTYPTSEHQSSLVDCRAILQEENRLSSSSLAGVCQLIQWMEELNILDLQEAYVDLFDRTPSLSLHLFEHIHGDSRERGQALVSLNELYTNAELMISTEEMPDFLPLFLEFLSVLPPQESQAHLSDAVNVIALVGDRLINRDSPYAHVFVALQEISQRKADKKAVTESLQKNAGKELSAKELDEQWAEQFAFENTSQTTGISEGCPMAQDMVRRMNSSELPLTQKQES